MLAGAGQFGTPDQGIFAYWLNAHLRRRPLRYIGFDGTGHQARDAFHPRDLAALLVAQMRTARAGGQRVYTAGGGPANTMSLAQLTAWCDDRFGRAYADRRSGAAHVRHSVGGHGQRRGAHAISAGKPRCRSLPFSMRSPQHAEAHPDWLDVSGV